MALRPERERPEGLADALERILDKGLVINADITVSVGGVELLGIKIRAALASFETAAAYGLEFPSKIGVRATASSAEEGMWRCPGYRPADSEVPLSSACPRFGRSTEKRERWSNSGPVPEF